MKKLFTREDVIKIIDEILQYPDVVIDAVSHENSEYGAEELFDMVAGGLFDIELEQ